MKTTKTQWLSLTGIAFFAFILSSWQINGAGLPIQPYLIEQNQDTSPIRKKTYTNRDYKIGNLDKDLKDLDQVMEKMENNTLIDFSKMEKEMNAAMAEIKKIDFTKISKEIKASMKDINWEKTRKDVDEAMRKAALQMKEVDMKNIEKEMEKAKSEMDIERKKTQFDMDHFRKNLEESLSKAKVGIQKAKQELLLLKEFTEALEKDGLIDKNKGYKVQIKNGEMYINGNKQSKEVNDKYRKYFKEEDYSIRSDGEEISSL